MPESTDNKPAIVFDRKINVPTIVAILVMIGGLSSAGLSLYAGMDKRVGATETTNQIQDQRIDSVTREATQARTDQGRQLDSINGKLDWLMRDRIQSSRAERGSQP